MNELGPLATSIARSTFQSLVGMGAACALLAWAISRAAARHHRDTIRLIVLTVLLTLVAVCWRDMTRIRELGGRSDELLAQVIATEYGLGSFWAWWIGCLTSVIVGAVRKKMTAQTKPLDAPSESARGKVSSAQQG